MECEREQALVLCHRRRRISQFRKLVESKGLLWMTPPKQVVPYLVPNSTLFSGNYHFREFSSLDRKGQSSQYYNGRKNPPQDSRSAAQLRLHFTQLLLQPYQTTRRVQLKLSMNCVPQDLSFRDMEFLIPDRQTSRAARESKQRAKDVTFVNSACSSTTVQNGTRPNEHQRQALRLAIKNTY